MKIAIITAGTLPIPAVQGGAVENLIDFCLEYNDKHHLYDITIYSIYASEVWHHPALKSKVNHYHYINVSSLVGKIKKHLFKLSRKGNNYYHYSTEYYLEQVIKHICKHSYDIIIVENRPGFILKLKDNTTSRLVIHQENDYLNTQVCQYQKIYDAASCIINTSDYITNCVRTIAPDDTKCKTVLNGIDINKFHDAKPLSREQMGLKKSDFVIVYSGRLTKEKGILELIQAMKRLQHIPNIKLLIIGASNYGKDANPTPFINQLEKEAESIKDRIVFTGFINYKNVPSYLKMADIAVVPSMWEEPFGLTVIEAMAAGLPLITTRSGGIPEICEGIATIVEKENIVDNLATAIQDLYEHPEKRKQMAKASLTHSKYYNKERYAKDFFDALDNI